MIDEADLGLEPYSTPKTFVKSGARAIAVLEYFYRVRKPARLIDLCNDLQFPMSSTKYLLATLVESGYLTFNKESKNYFPSITLLGFSNWLTSLYPAGDKLVKLATDLRDLMGESVAITVQNEYHMQPLITERGDTHEPVSSDFRIPLIGSASGGIALSLKTDMEILQISRRVFRGVQKEQRERRCDEVLSMARRFRELGYAYNYNEVLPTHRGVAIPLPSIDINVLLVLGISGPSSRVSQRETELVETMKQKASELA